MENQSLTKYKMSGVSGFVMVLLVLVLIGLGERVLYDISRLFVGNDFSYINDLSTLLVHALFVMILIVVAVGINMWVADRKAKYALVLIPYFVMALVLTLQVALEAAVYFYYHHTTFQFYLVMASLIIVTTMLIYLIQKRYTPPEPDAEEATGAKAFNIFGSAARVILGTIVGLILIGIIAFYFAVSSFF